MRKAKAQLQHLAARPTEGVARAPALDTVIGAARSLSLEPTPDDLADRPG